MAGHSLNTIIELFTKGKVKLLVGLFLASCAQIVAPTGGERDLASPKIQKSKPENFSLNYRENSISLTFDEYIQLKEWSKVIVSPPLKSLPETKIKGKTLLISWEDTLSENTTYAFNFGSSIVDFNESNPLDSNLFVFSTGSYLDSLKLSGTAIKAIDLKPEKEVLIMLYKASEDSVPYKEIPDYFTKTKENGSYTISNIKNGNYKLFALKDKNQNYLFDQPDELIGFSDSLISIESNTTADLSLFEEENQKLFIKKTFLEQYGKVTIVFNKPTENIEFKSLKSEFNTSRLVAEKGVNKDSLSLWITGEMPPDTLHLLISDGKALKDTIEIAIQKKPGSNQPGRGKAQNQPLKLTVTKNAGKDIPLEIDQPLKMKFNIPVSEYELKKIILSNDTDTLSFSGMFKDKALRRNFQVIYPFHPDSTYHVFIPDSTFSDIFGNFNDTIDFDFSIQQPDFYGTLAIKIKEIDQNKNNILQLLDDKNQLIREEKIESKRELKFEKLNPGKYFLKLIVDTDNNGKWTTGKYLGKKQAETIYLYSSPITIRSNWDMEVDWELK